MPVSTYCLCGEAKIELPPSPKLQFQVLMLPCEMVEPSLNCVAVPSQTFCVVNAATGIAWLTNCIVLVLVQPNSLVILRVTLKLPAVVYKCTGFISALVLPSPKFHRYVTILSKPEVLRLLNLTESPTHSSAKLKSAIGLETYTVIVSGLPLQSESSIYTQ